MTQERHGGSISQTNRPVGEGNGDRRNMELVPDHLGDIPDILAASGGGGAVVWGGARGDYPVG